MFRHAAPLLALCLLVMPALATARTPPRETVGAVAEQIRQRYFDAERGETIAAELEAEAAAGAFDPLTDPRDLAAALTERLRPADGHFGVRYSPPATAAAAPDAPAAGPQLSYPEIFARTGQGFTRVEVLPGNIGYIRMLGFANIDFDDPEDPARRAADAALDLVAGADAVIFDLRDNGGGAPSMVGYLVSAFTPRDAQIYNVFHRRQGTASEAPAVFYPSPRLETPLYVVISARTGSAGEALPYTLQAAGRATIVGEATAGAANPGGSVEAAPGFEVFISTGAPINPLTGGNWEGTGVVPDVEVESGQAVDQAMVLALEQVLAGDSLTDAARIDARWALEALTASPPADIRLADYAGEYGSLTVTVEGDGLSARSGRRPAQRLAPLERDLFYVVGAPDRRYAFERDGEGRVIALEQRIAALGESRRRRTD